MFSFFQDKTKHSITVTHSISSDIESYMDKKILQDLENRLVDLWVKKYGAAFLKEITPKQMKAAVKKNLEDKIADRVLNA